MPVSISFLFLSGTSIGGELSIGGGVLLKAGCISGDMILKRESPLFEFLEEVAEGRAA